MEIYPCYSTGRDLLQLEQFSQTPQNAKAIVRLFRSLASIIRQTVNAFQGGPAFDPAELDFEHAQEQAHEAALRRRYATAIFYQEVLDVRAAQHRIKFSPRAEPHHREAILDFLDDPSAPTRLTPMHASWFQALDDDGKPTFTMAHPVNRAEFLITQRYATRYGWQLEHYSAERAEWTNDQWLAHERRERELSASRLAAGRPQVLKVRDYWPDRRRAPSSDRSP